jgi:hypothetical protein
MKRIAIVLLALCLYAIPAEAADPTHLVTGQKVRLSGYFCHVLPALQQLIGGQILPEPFKSSMVRAMVGEPHEDKVCYRGSNLVTIVRERGKMPAALYGEKPDYLFEVQIEGMGKTMFVNSTIPAAPGL